MDKKNILTYQGLKKLEDELQELKVVRRKEVAAKIKEARVKTLFLLIFHGVISLLNYRLSHYNR